LRTAAFWCAVGRALFHYRFAYGFSTHHGPALSPFDTLRVAAQVVLRHRLSRRPALVLLRGDCSRPDDGRQSLDGRGHRPRGSAAVFISRLHRHDHHSCQSCWHQPLEKVYQCPINPPHSASLRDTERCRWTRHRRVGIQRRPDQPLQSGLAGAVPGV